MEHMTKAQLIEALRAEYRNFEQATAALSEAQMIEPGAEEYWSVKDIAAHLAFWQQRAVFYLISARDGYKKEADRWAEEDVDKRNADNYQAQHARPLADVIGDLHTSESDVIRLVEATPDEAIFTPGYFDWCKASLLVEAISGETYEHYQEHMGSLRAWQARHA